MSYEQKYSQYYPQLSVDKMNSLVFEFKFKNIESYPHVRSFLLIKFKFINLNLLLLGSCFSVEKLFLPFITISLYCG